jgi:pseudouridine-5'-phosphate glycosidase
MPSLDNPKHERFAQDLAKGKSAEEAYTNAGYKPSRSNASVLRANQNIVDRVAEIQDRSAIRAEITLQSLLEEAAQIQAAALKDGQYSASVAALTAKAKLAGLWVDKAESTNRNIDASRISDADLAAIVATDGSEDIAASQGRSTKPH